MIQLHYLHVQVGNNMIYDHYHSIQFIWCQPIVLPTQEEILFNNNGP